MNTTDMRVLTDAELGEISGGKYCESGWNGRPIGCTPPAPNLGTNSDTPQFKAFMDGFLTGGGIVVYPH
jgi:hypothetical protein